MKTASRRCSMWNIRLLSLLRALKKIRRNDDKRKPPAIPEESLWTLGLYTFRRGTRITIIPHLPHSPQVRRLPYSRPPLGFQDVRQSREEREDVHEHAVSVPEFLRDSPGADRPVVLAVYRHLRGIGEAAGRDLTHHTLQEHRRDPEESRELLERQVRPAGSDADLLSREIVAFAHPPDEDGDELGKDVWLFRSQSRLAPFRSFP